MKRVSMIRWAGLLLCTGLLLSPVSGYGKDWLGKGKSLLEGLGGKQAGAAGLRDAQIGEGLRETLRVGTESVVAQLGAADGFNADPAAHIPLPASMGTVRDALSKVGLSSVLDDLELKMNRAAEEVPPQGQSHLRGGDS